jgi:polar amino acid transport system substrate-binding protein
MRPSRDLVIAGFFAPMKLIVFSVLLSAFFCPSSFASTLSFATFHFPPYSNCNGLTVSGEDVEQVRDIAHHIGVPITIRCIPWRRILHQLRTGSIDGAFPALYLREREEFVRYIPTPVHTSVIGVASRAPNNFKTVQSMRDKLVGIEAGFFLDPELHLQAEQGKIRIIEIQGASQNLRMLQRGRIDVYVDNLAVMKYFTKELDMSTTISISKLALGTPAPAYLVLSKRSSFALENYSSIAQAVADISLSLTTQTSPLETEK